MTIYKKLVLFFLPSLLVCTTLISCSSTNGIDDYFTFNLEKSFTFSLSQNSSWAVRNSRESFGIDSADFAQNGTSLDLIKSIKLTKLTFTPDLPAFPISNFVDSLSLSANNDSLSTTQLLANYYGSNDSLYLSYADVANFLKNGDLKLKYMYHNTPQDLSYTAHYTLVLTASPKQ